MRLPTSDGIQSCRMATSTSDESTQVTFRGARIFKENGNALLLQDIRSMSDYEVLDCVNNFLRKKEKSND